MHTEIDFETVKEKICYSRFLSLLCVSVSRAHTRLFTRSIESSMALKQMHVNTRTRIRTQCHLWLRKFNIFDVSLSFMSFCERSMLPHDVSFYHMK